MFFNSYKKAPKDTDEYGKTDDVTTNRPLARKAYLLILLALFVFGVIAIEIIYYYWGDEKKPKKVEPRIAIIESPTPFHTPTPTATEKVDIASLAVSVLNGSGKTGEANYVARLLKDVGFENIETANADNYGYVTTEVKIKKDKVSKETIDILKKALSEYTLEINESLTERSEYALVIIIGRKND